MGNEFYALFLDGTMTYSCGIFEQEDNILEEASLAKYDRICRKLALSQDDEVLEKVRVGRVCHLRRRPRRLPGDNHHHLPDPA